MRDIKLPDGWKIGKLENLVSFTRGSEPGSDSYTEDDSYTRFLRVSDISGTSKKKVYTVADNLKLVNKGDLLLTLDGTPGIVSDQFEGAISSGIRKIDIANSKLLQDYLKFYLKSDNVQRIIYKYATGATILHASKSIHYIDVVLPSLETQKKIVQVLEKTKSAIEKKKEAIKLLDELVKSRFIGMFGDPVLNPKGWQKGKISDVIIKTQYGTSNKADEGNGEFKILRMNNITYDGKWDFSSIKYVDLDKKEQEKFLVYKGEVLFNRTNSKELVGKTAVYKEDEPMAYAGYLVKATPNGKANGEFISSYMNTKYIKAKLLNMAKSIVGMANINAEEFKKIDIYIPPIELQNQFAGFVKQVDKLKFVNNWNHRYLL
jgi:type I restriction enzyme S subunit